MVMNGSKGQFTIPNLVGVAVMLFIFSVLFNPIKQILLSAAGGSGPLTSAVIFTVPAIILLVILTAPFMLAQIKYERDMIRRERRSGRR